MNFLQWLTKMFHGQSIELTASVSTSSEDLNVYLPALEIRAVVDSVIEQIPSLLELGVDSLTHNAHASYTFPYHRPSIVSVATASTTVMPESLGFILVQVCMH